MSWINTALPMISRLKCSQEIAIDLGTTTTRIYAKGKGIILAEPSIVAYRNPRPGKCRLIAAGRQALPMLGRTTADTEVCWPVRDGVVYDLEAAELMLRAFLDRALENRGGIRQALISMPLDVTPLERRAFAEVAERAGAREVQLLYEPIAAAIGSNLSVLLPRGLMLVDVGSGITEAVIMTMGGIAVHKAVRRGGNTINEKIIDYVRGQRNFQISSGMAEQVKIGVGNGIFAAQPASIAARGKCLRTKHPGTIILSSDELRPVFLRVIDEVIECILSALQVSPPELAADICDDGIWLSGGSLLFHGVDEHIAARLGVKVHPVSAPLEAVALGNGLALQDEGLRRAAAFTP